MLRRGFSTGVMHKKLSTVPTGFSTEKRIVERFFPRLFRELADFSCKIFCIRGVFHSLVENCCGKVKIRQISENLSKTPKFKFFEKRS